jgi:Tfp pilus assembly protein PilX
MLSPSFRKAMQKGLSNDRGIALVTAIMACAILFALAMLVIQISTGDLRVSAKSVGSKKAIIAAEAGVHQIFQQFNPLSTVTSQYNTWTQVDSTNDPNSRFMATQPAALASAPLSVPGYSMEASKGFSMIPFIMTVTGQNTNYDTTLQVDIGMGFAPVPAGTEYH